MNNLEHVNITVKNAKESAAMLAKLFGWKIRWQGMALNGYSVHVGTDDNYICIYTPNQLSDSTDNNKSKTGNLNHIGIVVDDLDAIERKVKEAGYKPYNHDDYDPGRRFYFDEENGVEIEVVSYQA